MKNFVISHICLHCKQKLTVSKYIDNDWCEEYQESFKKDVRRMFASFLYSHYVSHGLITIDLIEDKESDK